MEIQKNLTEALGNNNLEVDINGISTRSEPLSQYTSAQSSPRDRSDSDAPRDDSGYGSERGGGSGSEIDPASASTSAATTPREDPPSKLPPPPKPPRPKSWVEQTGGEPKKG